MENSQLERLPDKVLIKLISNIINECEKDGEDWLDIYSDESIYNIFETNIKVVGVKSESIDVDYILSLIKLNIKEKFITPLKRPKIEAYEQDIYISETIYQTNVHRATVYSYNEKDIKNRLTFEEGIGYFSPFDWDIVHTQIHDSETTEIEYEKPEKINKF